MKTTTRRLLLTALALLTAGLLLPALSTQLNAAPAGRSMGAIRKGVGNVTNTTKKQARKKSKNATDDTGVIEEEAPPKWYVELTPGYMTLGRSYIDKFRGGNVAFGWNISPEDKIQIENGCSTGNFSGPITYTRNFFLPGTGSVGGSGVGYLQSPVDLTATAKAKATMIPMFLSYSYSIPLTSSRRFEIRLSPAMGFFAMKSTYNLDPSVGTFVPPSNTTLSFPDPGTITAKVRMPAYSGSDSMKLAFSLGAGAGFTWNITSRLYLNLAYRYYWVNHVTNPLKPTGVANVKADGTFVNADPAQLNAVVLGTAFVFTDPDLINHQKNNDTLSVGQTAWNGTKSWNGMNINSYTLSLGWKF